MKTLRNAGIAIIVGLVSSVMFFSLGIGLVLSNLEVLKDRNALNNLLANAIPFPLWALMTIISLIVIIFTYFGFISLGKKFNAHFLIVVSWILMIVLLVNTIIGAIFSYLEIYLQTSSTLLTALSLITNILFLLSFVVFYILLGISLLKLNEKVEVAKTLGVLYIISASTLIIIIGAILLFITQIFAAIMFFKASKKLEKA